MNIIQVLDALDYGDGVSNDVINMFFLIKELGYNTQIYSKYVDERVAILRKDISKLKTNNDDIIIHHYSGFSNIIKEIEKCNCKKVMIYHNITPPQFLEGKAKQECKKGITQLNKIKDLYNYFVGDSDYNIKCLINLGICNQGDILPIILDFDKIDIHKTRESKTTNFLFVGRVAQNKKIEDIIKLFDCYYCNIDCKCKLFLVGNNTFSEVYTNYLLKYIEQLKSKKSIFFTGKVSNEDLKNYYLNADIFICMSEHEGFCIPLIESMYYQIPVLAYNAGAISYTMGNSGIILNNKNYDVASKLIYLILTNNAIKEKIIADQNNNLKRFYKDNVKEILYNLILKWSN